MTRRAHLAVRGLAWAAFLAASSLPVAGQIVAVAPSGASSGVVIRLTGTGFSAEAARNTISFQPPSGPAVSATAIAVTTLDATRDLRSLTVRVPDGLPLGPAAVRVANTATGASLEGGLLEVVALGFPGITAGAQGATSVDVRIVGLGNTLFIAGRVRATFGTGVSVLSATVESPSSVVVRIAVSVSATLGPRTVTVIASTQTLMATAAFAVVSPGAPINRAPLITSQAPTVAMAGRPYSYQAEATDPDGDPITFALTQAPAGMQVSAAGLITWTPTASQVGPQDVALAAADGRGGRATQAFRVTVAEPVTLTGLTVSPAQIELSASGETRQLAVSGQYSDGSTQDLTPAASGTTYETSAGDVATVGPDGLVTAVGSGVATITARNGGVSATSAVDVVLAAGPGFLRGETFDDRIGLPLGGAVVSVMADASGPLPAPVTVAADARGRYVVPVPAGPVVVRISKAGYTTVDRAGVVPPGGAVMLLDARLTPLDVARTSIAPVFGGDARNASGDVVLRIAPGTVPGDTEFAVTSLSGQGLAGRLPLGWSPLAAVDLGPGGLALSGPGTLQVANDDGLPADREVIFARYEPATRQWIALAPARVTPDGGAVAGSLDRTGQFAFLVPDDESVTGEVTPLSPLPPGTRVANPEPSAGGAAAEEAGVEPRSAPPGGARARGRLAMRFGSDVASGAVVQASVTERFDLLDQSQVVPLPFIEDLILYARPRTGPAGTLGATFPITPSIDFTIQQLSLGVVRLEVRPATFDVPGGAIGAAGGTIGDPDGARLDIPADALAGGTFIGLTPISPLAPPLPVPAGVELLGGATVDLVGTDFARGATLSMSAPAGLPADALVWLAEVFEDPLGGRRLRLAGAVDVIASRLVARLTSGQLAFPGVLHGGDYLFVRLDAPVGFVTGSVRGLDGTTPFPGALVTSSTAPFADLSSATGSFLVAAGAGLTSEVRAFDSAAGNAAVAAVTVPGPLSAVSVALTLNVSAPSVMTTAPANAAADVPLDSTIVVTFSEPVDPVSVTDATVILRAGTTEIAGARVLSADRRRVTFRPDAPLLGLTTYTLAVSSGIRDDAGNALLAFTPITFRTLDPSKPPQPEPGRITAELPDEDGFVIVTGTPGTAEAASFVTGTNLRTQETVTVLALGDGAFRLRLIAAIGDEIALTLRQAGGADTTVRITQLTNADGTTAIGRLGGTVTGAAGRTGRVRPNALTSAGTFRFDEPAPGTLPEATADFTYTDQFTLAIDGAVFNQLRSLTLSESQNLFQQRVAADSPFTAAGSLVVPPDFLVSASLRFTAVATDAEGRRTTAEGTTQVVGADPQTERVEVAADAQFPTAFLDVPRQAQPNQQVEASAVAPAARVEIELPVPAGPAPRPAFLLVRPVDAGAARLLSVLDHLAPSAAASGEVLRSSGRLLPGLALGGDYGVAAVPGELAFLTGRVTGPPAIVSVDGWPFAAETTSANGRFVLPVRAGEALTLRFTDGATLAPLGTAAAQAPATGLFDVGSPLGTVSSLLTVTATPDARSVVDIGQPIVFTFSEAVDPSAVNGTSILVTDAAGVRVNGRFDRGADGRVVTFTPDRRWRFGTRYRYGVAATMRALSGAVMARALSGEFTTFAPRVIATLALPETRDVAVSGSTVVAATSTGLALVDIVNPLVPALAAHVPVDGGVAAVRTASGPLTDRNGQAVNGPLAVAAGGGGAIPGTLQTFSLSTPSSPALLGRTQLTTPAGQTAPEGVRNVPGTPSALILDETARAIVAVSDVGVETVQVGQAIPLAAAAPGQGLGPRYPDTGIDGVNDVAPLAGRVIAAGASGVSVHDPDTLARVSATPTEGVGGHLSAVAGFGFDLNADGRIDGSTETIDLAVLANTGDSALQFFRVPSEGPPVLVSVVRLASPVRGVAVDASERLAYVGAGDRGLIFVDLNGPASIQPIDVDRDGVDDRILATLDTPGLAGRTGLALARGLAFIADGAAGMTVAEIVPPRVRLLTLMRDPARVITGDEEDVTESGIAYNTDDDLRLSVEAAGIALSGARLIIEESPPAGGTRLLAFDDGTVSRVLEDGPSTVTLRIDSSDLTARTAARLRVVTSAVTALASRDVSIVPPEVTGQTIDAILLGPVETTLGPAVPDARLSVSARTAAGRYFNVTRGVFGTTYSTELLGVAVIDADGVVTARAGGTTAVAAENGGLAGFATVTVQLPRALVALRASPANITVRLPQAMAVPVQALYSDGSDGPVTGLAGVAFATADPAVATIDASGNLLPVATGTTRISVTLGDLRADVDVAVDLRVPPSITGIAIEPLSASVSLDERSLSVRAAVTGTGSLDDIAVTFDFTGAATDSIEATTSVTGQTAASLTLPSATGALSVVVRVTDPASGTVHTASASTTLVPGAGDHEPNDSDAGAPTVTGARPLTGRIGTAGDPRDVYNLATGLSGTVVITVDLAQVPSGDVFLVVRDANGQEISRVPVTSDRATVTVQVPDGSAFVSLETAAGIVDYTLTFDFRQGEPTITSVTPSGGGAGSTVVIEGSGFGTSSALTAVLFGGVVGKTLQVTPTRLTVQVPANAVNGPVEVIAGQRRVRGPDFVTGIAGPLPAPFVVPLDGATLRRDPTKGLLVSINRLVVAADPVTSRAAMDAIAQRHGGRVAVFIPITNSYTLEFPSNLTFDGLAQLARLVTAEPGVRYVVRSFAHETSARDIDPRQSPAPKWPGTRVALARAFEMVRSFEAIDVIRSTAPFRDAASLRRVRAAVIDDGFQPNAPLEFIWQAPDGSQTPIVEVFSAPPGSTALGPVAAANPGVHGTPVSGIIGALNNGSSVAGVLNGVFGRNEQPFMIVNYAAPVIYTGADGLPVFTRAIDTDTAKAALALIHQRNDIDVVNMSFGADHQKDDAEFQSTRQGWLDALRPLAGRTLAAIAAGNGSVRADVVTPAAVAALPGAGQVITVGAVGVANVDHTGEGEDRRAIFGLLPAEDVKPDSQPCVGLRPQRTGGSNCGSVVEIAAPGEDVFTTSGKTTPFTRFDGTSAAAPFVAGVAALVQAIRSTAAPMPPDDVRRLLIATADDISDTWRPLDAGQTMGRLNALTAVRAVLETGGKHLVYVMDPEAPLPSGRRGAVVGIEVDPLTGNRFGIDPDARLELVVSRTNSEGQVSTVNVTRPVTMTVSPDGQWLYVLGETDHALGDGIVVIDTRRQLPSEFMPLSGATFPVEPTDDTYAAVRIGNGRASMVPSKDGRLLYLAFGKSLRVLDATRWFLADTFGYLPSPFSSEATDFAESEMSQRLAAITQQVERVDVVGRGGLGIASLEVSADGRTLYAAVQTGGGGGRQPGFVLPIDVDLSRDKYPESPTLEPDLATFLTVRQPVLRMVSPAASGASPTSVSVVAGDEPSDLGVDPLGRALYLTHGGVDFFEAIPPDDLDISKYTALLAGSIIGVTMGGAFPGGSLLSLAMGMEIFRTTQATLYDSLLLELQLQARTGRTLLGAPGFTGVFDTSVPGSGGVANAAFGFPGRVTFGWNPSPSLGGTLVDQFSFPGVFAARPQGIAIRPDGHRGIVAFFQTGNFGILDLDAQQDFTTPAIAGSPDSQFTFTGVVAATPALRLDSHLWPSRGAFTSGGVFVPSPDESLLFAGPVVYAQNGRFAVATHAGNRPPREIDAVLSFAADNNQRLALNAVGFSIAPGATSGTAPDGRGVASGSTYTFTRGGGALTILRDSDITSGLDLLRGATYEGRPYLATAPLCETPELIPLRTCDVAVSRTLFEYEPVGGAVTFHRPRAVAVQPFVGLESPRHGDHVRPGTALQVLWRDPTVTRVRLQVFDAADVDRASELASLEAPATTMLAPTPFSFKRTLAQVLGTVSLVDGERYRLVATPIVPSASGRQALSSIDVIVTFRR